MNTAHIDNTCPRQSLHPARPPARGRHLISAVTLGGLLALNVLASAPTAHAGTKSQGTKSQGTKSQGTKSQGTKSQGTKSQDLGGLPGPDSPWLSGVRLHGFLPTEQKSNPRVVEVLGFRGDRVNLMVWTATEGWHPVPAAPTDLVGMRWLEHRCQMDDTCPRIEYRIRAVARDRTRNTMPAHADNASDTWLYLVEARRESGTGRARWTPVCEPSPPIGSSASSPVGSPAGLDARSVAELGGLFVDGQWRADGSWLAGGYTFACQRGVIAKCARGWGYKPWKALSGRDGRAVPLGPLHRACIRAARADYCGDGISYTRDGTIIDMFDRYGFNVRARTSGFTPEAGFSGRGAVWLNRPRHRQPRHVPGRQPSTCVGPLLDPTRRADDALVTVWSRDPRE